MENLEFITGTIILIAIVLICGYSLYRYIKSVMKQ